MGASPRQQTLFFEVFEALPRQGPGNLPSARRALALCAELPERPTILDLGCGSGAQTRHLVELTAGTVVALDSHAPFIERLQHFAATSGLESRIEATVGDMANLAFEPHSFDLVWSEGALYNIGLPRALPICRRLLRPGGYLVFTDAVWLEPVKERVNAAASSTPTPVLALREAFDVEYPGMGTVRDALEAIAAAGFTTVDHFPLPKAAWWDDFYTPMLERIAELRSVYATDDEALAILEKLAQEPTMHREHSAHYGYELFVARAATTTRR